MIPFLDLKSTYTELKSQIDQAVERALSSGWYIGGQEVDVFETKWAEYCETKYSVAVANGLDALHLGLLALGVGPGDEVIVPSNTYIATWLAVSQCGARPVPVEPIEGTYNIDPSLVADAITAKTRAIIPVHLYGQPADLDPLLELAEHHGLRVLEDGAQAHGASYKGRRLGGHGDITAWSFYPGKNLGAFGDGGAITTNSAELADRIRVLRNYGSRVKYVNELKGYNSRLDPVQAAVLSVKLDYLDEWNQRRKQIADLYLKGLSGSDYLLPQIPTWADPVWHLFVIRTKARTELIQFLNSEGIGSLIHYPIPPHRQEAYSDLGLTESSLPLASVMADEVLSLPMGPHLSAHQALRVIEVLNRFTD